MINVSKFQPMRQRLKYVTLSGIDASTPIETLVEIARRYPYVEFAVNYNYVLQGGGRFPTLASINGIVQTVHLHSHPVNLALHVWGRSINDLLDKEDAHVAIVAKGFQRIQLNLLSGSIPFPAIKTLQERFPKKTVTIRHRENMRSGTTSESIAVLTEKGEHGLLADMTVPHGTWHVTHPASPRLLSPVHGSVSDLSPKELAQYMRELQISSADSDFCICMESSLRNEQGEFDVALVLKALSAVEQALLIDDELGSVSRSAVNEVSFASPARSRNVLYG